MADLVQNNIIRRADLTDEQITTIKKKIINQTKASEYFDKFCEHESWEKGSDTMSYRRLVYPKVKPEDVKPLTEGVAPRPTKIAYATFLTKVEDYGERTDYTSKSKNYNFDDVVRDAGSTLSYLFTKKLDYLKGKPFISSKCIITQENSLVKTMRKAKIVLNKNEAQKYLNGNYLMMATPEVLEILQDELEAKGSSLDEATKEELAQGVIYKKKGFVITECPSDLLHKDDSTHYVVFIGRTPEGKMPVVVRKMGDIEVYNNPLGSGVITDEDGKITDDANRQKGSISMNANGLASAILDDMCILVCEYRVDTIKGSELSMSERSEFVSSSGKSELTIKAIQASDGNAVDAPTIVVKENDDKGATINANDGVYILTAGKKYYYSVAKTNFTTATGFYNATADDTTLTVSLTAAPANTKSR